MLWGRPVTAWRSIVTGFTALSLIIYAIFLMHGRVRRWVHHKRVAFIALGVIAVHGLIAFTARFILGV